MSGPPPWGQPLTTHTHASSSIHHHPLNVAFLYCCADCHLIACHLPNNSMLTRYRDKQAAADDICLVGKQKGVLLRLTTTNNTATRSSGGGVLLLVHHRKFCELSAGAARRHSIVSDCLKDLPCSLWSSPPPPKPEGRLLLYGHLAA